jgi:D-serine deaminase-like pyridoxal phosphate-dependent protein
MAKQLTPRSINVIIDNIAAFQKLHAALPSSLCLGVFIKIDTGYHRAGIETSSPKFAELVETVASTSDRLFLKGFYSHYGHSYAGSSEEDAAEGLIAELAGLEIALKAVPENFEGKRDLVLTVGATPTTTAAQNMLSSSSPRVQEFHDVLNRLKAKAKVELHAGVYTLLDCQQVATHARPPSVPSSPEYRPLSKDSIAIRMLLEVSSVYDEREKPEALVSAGSIALGREPCKSYPGWGIVTSDLGNGSTSSIYDESKDMTGWIVGRISQEHGILTWEGDKKKCNELEVGSKVMVWPNHACMAGPGFWGYLVVDSDSDDAEIVKDVWIRWRGW